MNSYGKKLRQIKDLHSVREIAELMEVHPNTVRSWVKGGALSAAPASTELMITGASLRRMIEQRRMKIAEPAVLSGRELQASSRVLPEVFALPAAEVDLALSELEEYHHITLKPDQTGDWKLWIHTDAEPERLIARIIKRMLTGNQDRRTCPRCGGGLPGVLRAGTEPRPKHAWKMDAVVRVPGHTGLTLVSWSHWCEKCRADAQFLYVDRRAEEAQPPRLSSAVLRVRRPSDPSDVLACAGDTYLALTDTERRAIYDAPAGEDVTFEATVALAPAGGLAQRRYPWVEIGIMGLSNARIDKPGGDDEYVRISEGAAVTVAAHKESSF